MTKLAAGRLLVHCLTHRIYIVFMYLVINWSRDGADGTATCYGTDGPGIVSR